MPIDYSKWDNLDVSSSSEDEHEDDAKPHVTRLDAPTKVTFGKGLVSAEATATSGLQAPQPKPSLQKSTTPASWTDHGGLVNTKTERNLYWSQDRYSVTLRLELAATEKIQSVAVDGILPYADRFSAVGSTKPKLVVSSLGAILLEGELPHPVHLAEDDDDDDNVDWSIEDTNGHRLLCMTLHKAVPMQGLSVWWRRPLMEFPEADLGQVKGGNEKSKQASKEFLDAWEEAHKIFRENKQKQKS